MDRETSSQQNNDEVIMLPLSEIVAIRWTVKRGKNLKKIRGQMSLQQLARKVADNGYEVSRQYLQRLESDPSVQGVPPEMLRAISESLEVKLSDLLCLPSKKILQLGVDNCN